METNYTNKLFTIVCISCVPVAALILLFNFVVLGATKKRNIDLATCMLLLGRVGHACAVVILIGVHTLEGRPWTFQICRTLVWMWITFWTLDLFTTLLFLIYTSVKLGHKKRNIPCHMMFLLFFSTGLAILAGSFTYITDWLFHNYVDTTHTCVLGMSIGEQPIRVGALFVVIIGGLLIIVLMITISAESRAQALKYKLQHPEVISATHSMKRKSQNGNVPNHRTEMYEIIDITDETDNHVTDVTSQNGTIPNGQCNTNQNNNNTSRDQQQANENIRTWRYIDSQLRDTRRVYGVAVACTVLLNLLPQLVLYSIDSVSGSPYTYSHHVLVVAGLVHSVVLPATFCTTGVRYRATAVRLIKNAFGGKEDNHHNRSEIPEDVDNNIVFHIRDVTLTETSDVSSPQPHGSEDVKDTANSHPPRNYKREQLQVLSMTGSPSVAASGSEQQKHPDEDQIKMTTVAVLTSQARYSGSSDKEGTLKGTVNPGYVENEEDVNDDRLMYGRSQSDAVVDYYDGSDSEWGSWDSDSETWSNLYDESDIEEVLQDNRSGKSNSLSPNIRRHRRKNSHYTLIEIHHKRNLDSQFSLPVDGQSPNRERRKSVDGSRKKKKVPTATLR